MTRAQKTLSDLLSWSGSSEIDLYPFVRDFFNVLLGYPKDHIRLAEKGSLGRIPDISLVSADAKPKNGVYWIVCEVKRERRVFRSHAYCEKEWSVQLRHYVSADTVYALLMDPETIVILRPDGSKVKTVDLEKYDVDELLSPTSSDSLAILLYSNSVCETSLNSFKEGLAPSRYLNVTNEDDRAKFYEALRVSARELIDYSLVKLGESQKQYKEYQEELASLNSKVGTVKDESVNLARMTIEQKYKDATHLFNNVLNVFESQIGRQMPTKEDEARRFLLNLYATEGSSLVLARILFVRFLEDHDMALRKISNGGIKVFREYHRYIKDDYRFLLTDAYREAEQIYRRLFEPSIFDWSHEGDGQLSRLLLMIFYRLNAFDFSKISGDILGNLYERFLDVNKRKKLGEYYTPMYIAKYVLERMDFYENPAPLLDPACGSGTFLIAAAMGLIERMQKKGVKTDVCVSRTIELIHGLDINVFAAFIAQLQLLWHLLPYIKSANIKELPELKIYGGNNSLVYLNQRTLTASFLGLPLEAPVKVRDSKYRYVVGNPPYIRNERLKDTGPWRKNYDAVDFRNSDIAYFFVARAIEGKKDAMPPWLEENGRMCFVLPMGLCDSQAAKVLRKTLLKYRILEVTDLEDIAIHIFPSPQASGRATVAPVLLFVEKDTCDNNLVNIIQVTEEAAHFQKIDDTHIIKGQVEQTLFLENDVNPYGQILPKIQSNDIPILKKLMTHDKLTNFTSTPTFGVTIGGAGGLYSEPGKELLPLAKGSNVSTFRVNLKVKNWVDLNSVRSKSIWNADAPKEAYVVSRICLAPQCSLFDPTKITFNDSTIIFLPKLPYSDFPWDALINSSIVRYIHLLILRTALVGVGTSIGNNRRASWCTINPRTVSTIPVPKELLNETEILSELRDELSLLAKKIATRWETVDDAIDKFTKKPLALYNIDFKNWSLDIEENVSYNIIKEKEIWKLVPFIDEQSTLLYLQGSYEQLNVLKYLLENKFGEALTVRELQNIMIPEDYITISKLLEIARDPNSADIQEFKKIYKEIDDVIVNAYGLDEEQWRYIQTRLATPPFDVLEPRWPWKAVEMRDIQAYNEDRFV